MAKANPYAGQEGGDALCRGANQLDGSLHDRDGDILGSLQLPVDGLRAPHIRAAPNGHSSG